MKAVAFDLGGVLIRINHKWPDVIAAAGLHCPDVPCAGLGGFPAFDDYQDGLIGREDYLDELRTFLGLESRDDAYKAHMAILVGEYPGVTSIIQDLTSSGVACGCLSNTSEMHWETFFDGRLFTFGPLLSIRVGSHLERVSKPNPMIYEAFERESGAIGPEIVYFDDGPANVEAATSRGWRAYLIDTTSDPAAQIRHHL